MIFANVSSNARDRYTEALVFLNHIQGLEPAAPNPPPLEVKMMRGLFIVQLYGAFEKSINELVEAALLNISSKGIQNNHFSTSFNPVSAQSRLQGYKDCGYKKKLEKAIEIFQTIKSKDEAIINETMFANELQNVWYHVVDQVRVSFGLGPTPLNPRSRAVVDELVEKRNAIAHGRETAALVGGLQNCDELRRRLNVVQQFNYLQISHFENYCDSKKYIKPPVRRRY